MKECISRLLTAGAARLVCGLLGAASMLPLHADEGMWMAGALPPHIVSRMHDLGCTLKPGELYNTEGTALKDAVVLFGGFCTGVVVSPEGLVFTNHHCGFDAIQQASSPQHDYVKNGFVARTRDEEWSVPGLYVSFLQRSVDVTDRILPLLRTVNADGSQVWVSDERSYMIVDSVLSLLQNEVEAEDATLRVDVDTYYESGAFYMNVYRDYRDIRLVFAPPSSAGKFGGDTDNWVWPRETSDFSVFRIYTGPDGKSAEYSAQNVPLRPKRVVPVSLAGYREGDFSMTIGYPGSTSRYLSSYGIVDRMNTNNTPIVDVRGLKQSIWKQAMQADPTVRLKYDSKYQRSSNYWKNSIGMNRCLTEQKVVEQKRAFEKEVSNWIVKNRKKAYEGLFDRLNRAYEATAEGNKQFTYAVEALWTSSDLLNICRSAVRGEEGKKPAEADLQRLARSYRDLDVALDARTLAAMLRAFAQEGWGGGKLPTIYKEIIEKYDRNYTAYVRDLYDRTVMTDSAKVMKLVRAGKVGKLKKDPLFDVVKSISNYVAGIQRMVTKNTSVTDGERLLCQAVREMKAETPLYSDANMTMRLSYGVVGTYTPAPGVAPYPLYTTPQSLAAKVSQASKNADYKMESDLLKVITSGQYGRYADKESGTLQLCYLTNNDITGGNSGSPMFNGRGELCGLAFDGNWESMANDIQYNPALTRCIGVDIRFVLYLMDRWGNAGHLINEMQLVE